MYSYENINRTHFHKKRFALNLVLKVRIFELGNAAFQYQRRDLPQHEKKVIIIIIIIIKLLK